MIINKEMDPYDSSTALLRVIFDRGAFPSLSNDTKQEAATLPTQSIVSLLHLYLNQSYLPLASKKKKESGECFFFPTANAFDTSFYLTA